MADKITTIAACRIANVDRQRFNEYVAGGDYQCAPPTIAGRARRFDENDTIALWVFGKLIYGGMKPLSAGFLACQLLDNIKTQPDQDVLTLAVGLASPQIGPVANGFDPSTPHDRFHTESIFETRAFNIKAIRALVQAGINDARAIGLRD